MNEVHGFHFTQTHFKALTTSQQHLKTEIINIILVHLQYEDCVLPFNKIFYLSGSCISMKLKKINQQIQYIHNY